MGIDVPERFGGGGIDDQNAKWLLPLCSGSKIGAIAITEPGTGSDLAAITTAARLVRDGFVLNGAKTFVTNGTFANTIIVTDKSDPVAGKWGMSRLVVEDTCHAARQLGLIAR